jgi:putative ubiquitin-RnfH superfamily antitoxin RatB of RatAB toxin-antitoxin module
MEREKYVNKLKQLETDLILLDNNIGFFAKSKKTESLIKDVKRKIEQTKSKIEFLKEKIRVIDEIDQGDD